MTSLFGLRRTAARIVLQKMTCMLRSRRVEPVAVEQTGEYSLAFTKLKDLNEFVGYWEGKGKMPESDNLSESGAKWAGMPIVVKRHVFWGPGMSSQIANQVWEIPEKYPFDRLQSAAGIPMKRRSSSTSIPRIWGLGLRPSRRKEIPG